MLNNVTVKRHNDGRYFKVIATMPALKMLMLLLLLPLVLRASASARTLAEGETNKFRETSALTKNMTAAIQASQTELRQFPFNGFMMTLPPAPQQSLSPPGCPLCDASVYSYCSYKVIYDSCCCAFPGAAIHQKPPQCSFYDCTLLYAKSCYEHSLIKNCCCNNPY